MLKKLPFFLPLAGLPRAVRLLRPARDNRSARRALSCRRARGAARADRPREICYFGGSFCRFAPQLIKEYLDCVTEHAPAGRHRALLDLPRRPARRRAARPRQKISYFKNRARHPDARPRRPRRMPPRGRPRKNIRRYKNAKSRRPAHRRADDDRAAGTEPRKQPRRPARARAALKGADSWELRLYPCLVIEGTELCRLYERGEYRPLSVEAAALWGGEFIDEALEYGFVPIRIGLQETESLAAEVAAGPHHPALGELILAESLGAQARARKSARGRGLCRAAKCRASRDTGASA